MRARPAPHAWRALRRRGARPRPGVHGHRAGDAARRRVRRRATAVRLRDPRSTDALRPRATRASPRSSCARRRSLSISSMRRTTRSRSSEARFTCSSRPTIDFSCATCSAGQRRDLGGDAGDDGVGRAEVAGMALDVLVGLLDLLAQRLDLRLRVENLAGVGLAAARTPAWRRERRRPASSPQARRPDGPRHAPAPGDSASQASRNTARTCGAACAVRRAPRRAATARQPPEAPRSRVA